VSAQVFSYLVWAPDQHYLMTLSKPYRRWQNIAVWTQQDLDLVIFLAQDLHLECWAIGRLLYRSTNAIRSKLFTLTGKHFPRGREPYWPTEIRNRYEAEAIVAQASQVSPFMEKSIIMQLRLGIDYRIKHGNG
jgi:hypothetical protein